MRCQLIDEMNDAAEEVRGIGVDAITLPGSVADYTGVLKHGRAILEKWGRIDVLVNNAGVSQPKTLLEISEQEYDETIAINLKGCFAWCKAVAPTMLERKGGRIVNISSVSAHMGASPNESAGLRIALPRRAYSV